MVKPPANYSDPLFIVPDDIGSWVRLANSYSSSMVVNGCTRPPLLLNIEYVPTNGF